MRKVPIQRRDPKNPTIQAYCDAVERGKERLAERKGQEKEEVKQR